MFKSDQYRLAFAKCFRSHAQWGETERLIRNNFHKVLSL